MKILNQHNIGAGPIDLREKQVQPVPRDSDGRRHGVDWLVVIQNRELQIMRVLDHPNICSLRAYFYSQGDTKVRVIKKKSK